MAILITGGAGYIGSHAVKILNEKGYETVVIDNFSKGYEQSLDLSKTKFYNGNTGDKNILDKIFKENKIYGVMHFAAYSLVAESMERAYEYYKNNVSGTLELLGAMVRHGVKRMVFSSTAAVYGIPESSPITEETPAVPINPYGETKLAIEKMLKWFDTAYGLKSASLRYFNIAGAHESGEIGEDHNPETHLIPIILSAANGERESVQIYGSDYNTPDGTCIRDYIHVKDLIDAHIKAYEYLENGGESAVFNLGSGGGYSNLEVLEAARKVTGHPIPAIISGRRSGDPDTLIASSEKAEKILGWKRRFDNIEDIIASAWKWHSSK